MANRINEKEWKSCNDSSNDKVYENLINEKANDAIKYDEMIN